MNERELREAHLRVSHTAKEMLVAANGGPIDHDVRIFLVFADGCAYAGQPGPQTGRISSLEAAEGMIWKLVATSVHILWANHGKVPVTKMHITHEGYAKPVDYIDRAVAAPDYMWGDMVEDYENNPDSQIVEVLCTMVWDSDGSCVAIEPFRYGDGGTLRWGELLTVMDSHLFNGMAADILGSMWSVVA